MYTHYLCTSCGCLQMLPNNDTVKLVNIGEPRQLTISDVTARADDFVYITPEVLQGAIYTAQCDMYSLGLMTWELWNQERAFKLQRSATIHDFIAKYDKSALTQSRDDVNHTGAGMTQLMTQCLAEHDSSITSTTFVNEIRKLCFKVNSVDE